MQRILSKIYHNTLLGNALIFVFHNIKNRLWPDSWVVRYNYYKSFGKKLNLKNPKTLNEKINWLKLYDRREIQTLCADKLAVRDYVSSKIGKEHLIPLLFSTKFPNEITYDNLPEFPCVIKTNHDSGGVVIVHSKSDLDFSQVQKQLRIKLNRNYYRENKEWQYKNIVPNILVEKLLLTEENKIPMDYKVHCFNGKAHMIQVDIDRDSCNHYRNWYYPDWKRCPFFWPSKKEGYITKPADYDLDKPNNLKLMIELSNKLSSPFPYVRIDWYALADKIYFGEITFHHDSGTQPIIPREWDYKLGELVDLNTVRIE
ncbi:ATP-grasp fold amidoligase family protein [Croceivirga sp. JEA036]|uniref:ATP-grasp fold amidoligase family protein n=1 Tax=Croceivirga sp. JEA036 TaxID=2721162 RepID=UPI001439491C|nr:ATP-grasp fold amidoligase family protein [Croceivirga sp. JEA036]NJB35366.1 glycosyl transferase [Croceivirga sp. JEA036]